LRLSDARLVRGKLSLERTDVCLRLRVSSCIQWTWLDWLNAGEEGCASDGLIAWLQGHASELAGYGSRNDVQIAHPSFAKVVNGDRERSLADSPKIYADRRFAKRNDNGHCQCRK
jgi:hypothetical protein